MPDSALFGSDLYLGSILANVHLWGILSDKDSPAMMVGSFEVLANDGALTLDALVGDQGDPGENMPIVDMQWDSIEDVDDLPDTLTDSETDIGRAWWIGNQVHVWDGHEYRVRDMGTPGPPGPVPDVAPTVELLNPDDNNLEDTIVVSGTRKKPGWHFKLKAPRGPQGHNATIRDASDYDDTTAPEKGQAIVWNGTDFQAQSIGDIMPKLFSIPEGNFTNFTGLSTRQQIGSLVVPPQPFDWIPYVQGHIRAVGVEFDADPLILGCEVRLGDPHTGQVVGRGFGNISTWTVIVPQFSTHSTPNDAVTPDNGTAVVPAHTTGKATTIYVNLFNDGAFGAYNFDKKGAQLTVLCVPVNA